MLANSEASDGARFDSSTQGQPSRPVPPFAAKEVNCTVVPCDHDALRREVEQLTQSGLQLSPIIPCALDIRKTSNDLVYTGKNPSYWGPDGEPRVLKIKEAIPSTAEVLDAIANAEQLNKPIGLAVLPRVPLAILDFDAHKFDGAAATLDQVYNTLLEAYPELANTRTERTPGGGLHIYLRLKDNAGSFRRPGGGYCVNFALDSSPDHHCGELLCTHRIAVAYPTVLKTDKRDGAYELVTPEHAYDFVEIHSLDAIGVVPLVRLRDANSCVAVSAHTSSKAAEKSGPPLEHLIGLYAYNTVQGEPSYGDRNDRSYQLAGVTREVYSRRNFCITYNLAYIDDWGTTDEPGPLMLKAIAAVGIEHDRSLRVIDGVPEADSTISDLDGALMMYRRAVGTGIRPADASMTENECRIELQNAARNGATSSDLDTLVSELGRCSSVPFAALNSIRKSVEDEQAQVDDADQEQQRLEAQLVHEGKSSELTLDYFFPEEFAGCLRTVTENLPYNDIVATATMLTTVSGVVKLGTRICGNVLTSFDVPANLYTATVGPSGRKKTPLESQLVKDPCCYIKSAVEQHNSFALQKWQQQCAEAAEDKSERPPKPKRLFHQLQDCTDESLMEQLEAREAAMFPLLLRRDELSGLLQSQNQYRGGRGSDEQKLLEYFDGHAFMSTRVKGERGYETCHLSVYGGIQNELLKDLVAKGDANGKWARFLFVPLPNRTQRLPFDISKERTMRYQNCREQLALYIQQLWLLEPKTYTLCKQAIERFADYEFSKQEQQQSNSLSAARVLYGKSAGKVLRIACLLHLVEMVVNGGPGKKWQETGHSVPPATLEKAIKLVDYLDEWALGFHKDAAASSNGDVASNKMRRLHTIALEHSPKPVAWTDMRGAMNSKEKRGLTVSVARGLLERLQALGVGVVSEGPSGGLQYAALRDLPH